MTLAEELARTCVSALRKQAADEAPAAAREQFETSTLRERLLRRHGERLQELAKSRAAEEDTSPGGYAETAAKRLFPMPHTVGEAAVRLPAMLAGGAYGHYLARPYETSSADVIHSVLAGKAGLAGKGKGVKAPPVPQLEKRVIEYLTEQGKAPDVASDTAQRLLRRLGVQRPEHVEGALEVLPIFDRAKSKALRQEITGALGEKGLPFLRREIGLIGEPEVKTLAQRLGRLRWGGALAGGLAAGALTGIPYMARALYQKRQGGEAAVRARAEAQQALEAAGQEGSKREEILKQLEPPNQGSETVPEAAA